MEAHIARTPITIKDSFVLKQNSFDVADKINSNEYDGHLALQSGSVHPFHGYREGVIAHEAQVIINITPESLKEISDKVTQRLTIQANRRKVGFYVAGAYLEPAHVTLLRTTFAQGLKPEQIEKAIAEMKEDDKFKRVASTLSGRTITLDRLIVTGNGVILAAGDVVPETLKARNTLHVLSERHNKKGFMKTQDTRNTTHVTAGRFAERPGSIRLGNFYDDVRRIAYDIRRNPVEVVIDNVSLSTTLDIVKKEAPHLIRT